MMTSFIFNSYTKVSFFFRGIVKDNVFRSSLMLSLNCLSLFPLNLKIFIEGLNDFINDEALGVLLISFYFVGISNDFLCSVLAVSTIMWIKSVIPKNSFTTWPITVPLKAWWIATFLYHTAKKIKGQRTTRYVDNVQMGLFSSARKCVWCTFIQNMKLEAVTGTQKRRKAYDGGQQLNKHISPRRLEDHF